MYYRLVPVQVERLVRKTRKRCKPTAEAKNELPFLFGHLGV